MRDGGPAFPQNDLSGYGMGPVEDGDGTFKMNGMSLRDYFAAAAMQGILAGPCSRDGASLKEWFDIPEHAYRLAVAMLERRAVLNQEGRGDE